MSALSKPVLAYDSDCGPCRAFKRVVSFLVPRGRVEYLPLTAADSLGLLRRIPPSRRYASAHLIHPDGEVLDGADALLALLACLPAGRAPATLAKCKPGADAVRFLYSLAVRVHDSRSCAQSLSVASRSNSTMSSMPLT